MFFYEKNRSNTEGYLYNQNDICLNFQPHLHNSYEFVCCMEGVLSVTIEEKEYSLEKGMCLLVPPMAAHSYKTKEHSESYLCVFSQSYIPFYHNKYKEYAPINPIFFVNDLHLIINILEKNENEFYIKSCLYYVVARQIEMCVFEHINKNSTSLSHRIIEYLSENFADDITLLTLATQLGYSYNYISSMFNELFKTNFNDVLNAYRLNEATLLLSQTDKSITEIAVRCGYNSLRNFNRNFQKYKHKTPGEYRKTIIDARKQHNYKPKN